MSLEDFDLPISLQNKIKFLEKSVIDDLELQETENNKSIYEHVFDPKSIFGQQTIKYWTTTYSYDKKFLKDTQSLITKINNYEEPKDISFNEILDIYNKIKNNENFNKDYSFIEFDFLKHLNKNEIILECLSLYNISSPLISLITPIILLIIPFLIIKIQGYPITIENYLKFLKSAFQKHALGSLFTDFSSISPEKKIYILFSLVFYIYQIYQNIISCITFFNNLNEIHIYFNKIKLYLEFTNLKMTEFYKITSKLKTYKSFNNNLLNHQSFLSKFYREIEKISEYKFTIKKITELGYIYKILYQIKNDESYLQSLNYSFNFNGYLENLSQLKINIQNKIINFSSFSNKCQIENIYYPPLKYNNPIKNSINLNKHITITGPNASGKTTILKSIAFNIILNQQIGCGFFDKAKLKLFHYIHSYINIPDTSGRDSLFQAEARRCKEIIDIISNNSKNKNHLCIFDELYSGTNPYEAISSAYSLLDYINSYPNINFILTTHYVDLCEKLNKLKNIKNCQMNIKKLKNNNFEYTYKITSGISYLKGGTKVLDDLNYPKTIVSSINNTINKINL